MAGLATTFGVRRQHVTDFGFDFVHGEPEVGEGLFFGDAFFVVPNQGDGAEGDFPGFHEGFVAKEFGFFEELADGLETVDVNM